MFKKIIVLLLIFGSFVACDSEETTDVTEVPKKVSADASIEFEPLEILFDDKSFSDPKSVELLREINICSTDKQKQLGVNIPDCSPEFFKLFPLKSGGKLDDGFLLLTKANVGGVALRRILIFKRENGALVKLNGFVANLIGRKKSKTGYDDLLVRFKDIEEGDEVFFNCIVKWNGAKYEFKTVELIHVPASQWSAPVKAEAKDSVSKEILKTITENEMIF